MIEPNSDGEDSDHEVFVAQPIDELPKNRLVEQLAKGLSVFVQRMIKKHSYFVTIKKVECKKWTPAPREDATLTYLNY